MKREFRVEYPDGMLVLCVYSVIFDGADNLDDDWIRTWAEIYGARPDLGLAYVAQILVEQLRMKVPRKHIHGFGFMENMSTFERVFILDAKGEVVATADVRLDDASKLVTPSRKMRTYEVFDE